MANYPWFPEIRGGPLGPCPVKYSAGCMHFPPQRCLLDYSRAVYPDLFGCIQSVCLQDECRLPGEVLVQINFILVPCEKCLAKTHWAVLQPDECFPQAVFKSDWSSQASWWGQYVLGLAQGLRCVCGLGLSWVKQCPFCA